MRDFRFVGFCCYVCLLFGFCWSELEETGSLPETSSERQCPAVKRMRGSLRGLLSNFLPDPLRGLGLGQQGKHNCCYYYLGWFFLVFLVFSLAWAGFFLGFFLYPVNSGVGLDC